MVVITTVSAYKMAFTVISAKYPQNVDPTRTPLAYGDRAIPRLNRELKDENLIVRQRAVMALSDYLHDPEHIADALRLGLGETLKKCLSDADFTVRWKAVECLCTMAAYAIGRDAFLKLETIYPVAKLFEDPKDIVRKYAHMCVLRISETPPGAASIVEAQLILPLVEKLQIELDEIKELILDTLHFCIQEDIPSALEAGAMEVITMLLKHDLAVIRGKAARDIIDLRMLQNQPQHVLAVVVFLGNFTFNSLPLLSGRSPLGTNVETNARRTVRSYINEDIPSALEAGAMEVITMLLKHDLAVIRGKAARDIIDLSVSLEGKNMAVECGAVQLLRHMLVDQSSEVRAKAAGALMMIAITTKGKYTAIHSLAIKPLTDLVDDINSEVRLNAIKALTCIAEAPEGRRELLQYTNKIRNHEKDAVAAVAKAAHIAVKVITWLP